MVKHFHKRLPVFVLLLSLVLPAVHLRAQQKGKLKIAYSAKSYDKTKKPANGVIACTLPAGLSIKTDTGANISFFARNDVRTIPMELVYKKNTLPLKKSKSKKDNIVFTVQADEIFFIDPGKNNYSWKWRGRARPPVSPVAPVAGQEVKKVDCWAVLRVNKQTYISDTISIQIQ